MERDLSKFYDNIEIINKDFSIYKDEKGNMFTFNTVYGLTRVDYIEASVEKDEKVKVSEYEKLKFEKKIDDIAYKEVTKKVLKPKSDITGKQEDFTTIIEKEEKAVAIWNVSNSLNIFKSFNNKEEALEFATKVNEKIMEYLK